MMPMRADFEYPLTSAMSVSFQRYPYPTAGFVTELPTSWGALPYLSVGANRVLVPCPAGEAFWIGLVPCASGRRQRVGVLAAHASGTSVDAVTGEAVAFTAQGSTVSVPPHHGVAGVRRDDESWWPFGSVGGSAPWREIAVRCVSSLSSTDIVRASVVIEVVGPGLYRERGGGVVRPLDPAHRYGGWLLP